VDTIGISVIKGVQFVCSMSTNNRGGELGPHSLASRSEEFTPSPRNSAIHQRHGSHGGFSLRSDSIVGQAVMPQHAIQYQQQQQAQHEQPMHIAHQPPQPLAHLTHGSEYPSPMPRVQSWPMYDVGAVGAQQSMYPLGQQQVNMFATQQQADYVQQYNAAVQQQYIANLQAYYASQLQQQQQHQHQQGMQYHQYHQQQPVMFEQQALHLQQQQQQFFQPPPPLQMPVEVFALPPPLPTYVMNGMHSPTNSENSGGRFPNRRYYLNNDEGNNK
jgi:hypothetical protein